MDTDPCEDCGLVCLVDRYTITGYVVGLYRGLPWLLLEIDLDINTVIDLSLSTVHDEFSRQTRI